MGYQHPNKKKPVEFEDDVPEAPAQEYEPKKPVIVSPIPPLIVGTIPGLAGWLAKRGIKGIETRYVDPAMLGPSNIVYGSLPLVILSDIRKKGVELYSVQISDVPDNLKGKRWTAEDLETCKVRVFKIEELKMVECALGG